VRAVARKSRAYKVCYRCVVGKGATIDHGCLAREVDMELSEIIVQYVRTKRASARPLSITNALKAIRTAEGRSTLSDRELSDLIAAAAIDSGLAIDFDTGTMSEIETAGGTGGY